MQRWTTKNWLLTLTCRREKNSSSFTSTRTPPRNSAECSLTTGIAVLNTAGSTSSAQKRMYHHPRLRSAKSQNLCTKTTSRKPDRRNNWWTTTSTLGMHLVCGKRRGIASARKALRSLRCSRSSRPRSARCNFACLPLFVRAQACVTRGKKRPQNPVPPLHLKHPSRRNS